ncbi:rubrerythrin-like domain-containing protein [Halobacterium zhouii]|nr:rubrerythrin-like domain-containing protein [Halobacterium zhouii]
MGNAGENTYECNDCGNRMKAEHQPEVCPKCGGDMIDISVSRE